MTTEEFDKRLIEMENLSYQIKHNLDTTMRRIAAMEQKLEAIRYSI